MTRLDHHSRLENESRHHEEELTRVGLENNPPAPMRYPRIVDENRDQLFLRCQVDGHDRECEITIGQAWAFIFTLLGWVAKASRR